jgi:hypothetical protein
MRIRLSSKLSAGQLSLLLCILQTWSASAAVRYVNVNSPSPASPYTSWATAAQTIQNAVDAAADGDQVLVTNGLYQVGGKSVLGQMNRVGITRRVTVRSVNGAGATTISGTDSMRCVYMTNTAALIGFTVAHGFALDQGGCVYGGSVSNCYITAGYSGQNGGGIASSRVDQTYIVDSTSEGDAGGAFNCVMDSCALTGNRTLYFANGGGGASESTLNNSILSGNSSDNGGGAFDCGLNNCLVVGNGQFGTYGCNLADCLVTNNSGDGVFDSTLTRCQVVGNSENGANSSFLTNCLVTGNDTGAFNSILANCSVTANASFGAWQSTLTNCTVAGNLGFGGDSGFGLRSSAAYNCIIYSNGGGNFDLNHPSTFNYCCSLPLPPAGIGNIINQPMFVNLASGDVRLQPGSPCINAGNNAYAFGRDLDDNPRIVGGTVDMGAYEFPIISLAGPGIAFNQFGFKINGYPSQVVVLEVSTDLFSWLPVRTNTLGSASLQFADPLLPGSARRFYRARTL